MTIAVSFGGGKVSEDAGLVGAPQNNAIEVCDDKGVVGRSTWVVAAGAEATSVEFSGELGSDETAASIRMRTASNLAWQNKSVSHHT